MKNIGICNIVFYIAFVITCGAAQLPKPIKDINPSTQNKGSYPNTFFQVGPWLLFYADDGIHGMELWRTDGTEAGTILLKDISRQDAVDPDYAIEASISYSINPESLVMKNGSHYFVAAGRFMTELWKTDGTPDGTVQVTNLSETDRAVSGVCSVNGRIYFLADVIEDESQQVYRLGEDGVSYEAVSALFPELIAVVGNVTYFVHADELWKTSGGLENAEKVYSSGGYLLSAGQLIPFRGVLYFLTKTNSPLEDPFRELWQTDGTGLGTFRVSDQVKVDGGQMFVLDSWLYFSGYDSDHGTELWRTDGTPNGASMFKDVSPGPNSGIGGEYMIAGNFVFFGNGDETHGTELWVSDGSSEGTKMVKDIYPGIGSGVGSLNSGVVANGKLYFSAWRDETYLELWVSDGTSEGTRMVRDLRPGLGSGTPKQEFYYYNGFIYFAGDDGVAGAELWRTDGTSRGTKIVKDIRSGTKDGVTGTGAALAGHVYFAADDGSRGCELWRSDGTSSGTALVKDIFQGTGPSSPDLITEFKGKIYFTADDGEHGTELWTSDGTPSGTVLLKDLLPGPRSSRPGALTVAGENLFFIANSDGSSEYALWKTDGTREGTEKLLDGAIPGVTSANIRNYGKEFVPFGNVIVFTGYDIENNFQPWRSDGTPEGTHLLKVLAGRDSIRGVTKVGDALYFSTGFDEFWKSDGTAEGTRMVAEGEWPRGSSAEGNFIAFEYRPFSTGETLYYSEFDSVGVWLRANINLWKSDGTNSGTTKVSKVAYASSLSIESGPHRDFLENFTEMGNKVFFTANDGIHGRELWVTDGTEQGTRIAVDITGDSGGSFPIPIARIGNKFFFSALSTAYGRELYMITEDDMLGPKIVLKGPNPLLIEASNAGYLDPGASAIDDEDGGLVAIQTSNSVSHLLPGSYTVSWSAVDSRGRTATADRTVIVTDTLPPTIALLQEIVLKSANPAGRVVNYAPAQANDIVGVVDISYSKPSGTIFPVGETNVVVTAKDAAGNSSTATFHVSIELGAESNVVARTREKINASDARIAESALWKSFGSPAVNRYGRIAYAGKWFSSTADSAGTRSGSGVFVDSKLVVGERDLVPGLPGVRFKAFSDPSIDDNGGISFIAKLSGNGITNLNDTAVFRTSSVFSLPLEVRMLAREGGLAPTSDGARWQSFTGLQIIADQNSGNGSTLLEGTLRKSTGTPRVSNSTDRLLCIAQPSIAADLSPVIREGDTCSELESGEYIKSWQLFTAAPRSPALARGFVDVSKLAFSARTNFKRDVFVGVEEALQITLITGEHYGLPTTLTWQAVGPISTAFAELGQRSHSIRANITAALMVPSVLSASELSDWKEVVRKGDPAPGGAFFSDFSDPLAAIGLDGVTTATAFYGRLAGRGVSSSNSEGLYWKNGNAPLKEVARLGTQATDVESGALWKRFLNLGLSVSICLPWVYQFEFSDSALGVMLGKIGSDCSVLV